MSEPYEIAILVGSLRKGSFSRRLGDALVKLAPDTLTFKYVEIGDLPYYNEDLENETPPAAWTTFRDAIAPVDGVLFITPEYNRSIPAVLKNAVDVGSRPYAAGVLNGKPAAIAAQTPGTMGAFGAAHHLRQMLVALGMPTMAHPELYIAKTHELVTEDGNVTNEGTEAFLKSFVDALAVWVGKHKQS